MGIIRNLKEKTKKEAKNQIKEKAKQVIRKILSTVLLKVLLIILAASFVFSLFTWVIEKFTAKDTPVAIYETLEVEQVNELVEVKGNENDGYHLEFAEDMDEKLDTLIDTLNRREGLYSLKKSDKELLKKMIKAEIVTQFPDLGGQVDENDSNQFQGAITVRRVTPDKEIGELKSTGAGEKTTADDLKADNNEEDTKITYEKGQELQIKQTAYVYLKGDYSFLGNKKSDDGVTEKRKTVLSKIEGVDSSIGVTKGDRVYYTGNTYYFENNTYIEIAKERDAEIVIGYVKNIDVEVPKTNTTTNDTTQNENNSEEEENQATKTIGDGSEEFVIAIAAGHNSSDDKGYSEGDFVEENLTIQVANKVEDLFKEYSNIKVIQTGSTSEQDVKREERTQLASDANPDICIQIYFNSGNGDSGVEAYYEYGDGKSQRLAELLSEKISDKMGLENKGTVTEEGVSNYYDIIDSSADTGFPSVITKGCFLDNKKDQEVLKNGGISQYAKGIVEACEEYLVTNKGDDTVTYVEQNDTYSRIRSRVYDLQYVPQETFKKYVDESDKRALEVYTLDDSYNLVTATWKVEGTTQGNAGFTINQNSSMNFRTILEKVTMPYEYLLFFLIDSDQKKFVEDLADVVIEDTEIIVAVQDNITTTEVNTTVQQCKKITSDSGNQAGQFAEGWHNVPDNEDEFTESCSTSVSVTYADTWFMKYSKGTTYSSKSLNVDRGEKVDLIKNVKGNVTETRTRTDVGWNNNDDGGVVIHSDSGSYSVQNNGTTSNYNYTYEIRERKETITHTISNSYNTSEEAVVSGDTSKFVKLFKKYKMGNAIAEEWLFDIIEDNERTANLSDLTRYMVFKATEIDYGVTDFDFSEFDLSAFEKVGSSSGQIPLHTPILTKEQFIQALNDFSASGALGLKSAFDRNFLPYAAEIYDVSVQSNVNPELVIVTALTEQGFRAGGGAYNYWGIAVYNGSNYGSSFSSLADGIRGFASVVNSYEQGEHAAVITQMYEERKAAGCNPLGYGLPGTLSGMQSRYSDLCGTNTKHRAGSSGEGCNYYLKIIYGDQFAEKCGNIHRLGVDDYTVTEHADYTAYQVQQKIDIWNDIFGKFGTLSGGGAFLEKATEVWNQICTSGRYTAYGGSSIPCTGPTVDCSSYVSWVLYEYGYTEFAGWQTVTQGFYLTNWNQKYGWEEIPLSGGQNPIDQLQPGDLIVRDNGDNNGHITLVVEIKDGRIYCYDCGNSHNWIGNNNAEPKDKSYMLTDSRKGKVIRVTAPN